VLDLEDWSLSNCISRKSLAAALLLGDLRRGPGDKSLIPIIKVIVKSNFLAAIKNI
jgi:hypothetical protein